MTNYISLFFIIAIASLTVNSHSFHIVDEDGFITGTFNLEQAGAPINQIGFPTQPQMSALVAITQAELPQEFEGLYAQNNHDIQEITALLDQIALQFEIPIGQRHNRIFIMTNFASFHGIMDQVPPQRTPIAFNLFDGTIHYYAIP